MFANGYGGGLAALPTSEADFVEFARRTYVWGEDQPRSGITWAIRLARGSTDAPDPVIGTTTIRDLDLENESAHIGWTAYHPATWGTPVNPECKLLLLGLAFANGFGRVKLRSDARNEHSRAAIEKLGATLEGVLRRHMRRADGTWRDSAVYSILADEWPGVRARLEQRIAAWQGGSLHGRIATAP